MPRGGTGHRKHLFPKTQEKTLLMDISRWISADTEIRLIIFFAVEDGEALYSHQKRPGADCGSDHELLIAKFRLKLKKVGKPPDHSGMT